MTRPDGTWKTLPAARVAPLEADQVPRPARLVLALIRRSEKVTEDYNVFRTFARLSSIFPAHTILVAALLKRGRLASVEKELVILRVAWRLGCAYEWGHHTHIARREGVSAEQIAASTTQTPDPATRLGAFHLATDELLTDHTLSDRTWATLRDHASDDELLELCMLVGHYVMVALTINTTGIQLEPKFAG